PADPDCHNNLGLALLFANQYSDAEIAFGSALRLRPGWPLALHNWGRAIAAQGRHQEALNIYSRALGVGKMASAALMVDMGDSLRDLGRHADALTSYDRALTLRPNLAQAHYGRGVALSHFSRFAEVLASYDQALAFVLDHPEIHQARGTALNALHRLDESLASFGRAAATNHENLNSLADYVQVASLMCDWTAASRDNIDLLMGCKNPTFEPMITLAISDDPALQRAFAEGFLKKRTPPGMRPAQQRSGSAKSEKIRLGYLSTDFRQHPVGVLMAELVELHNRS